MAKAQDFTISLVRKPDDLRDTITLFYAYAGSLDIDLSFQDFSTEMTSMPGKYAPPLGELLLAKDKTGEPIGCIGLRPLATRRVCEIKRLYVSPTGRGMGVGKALASRVIEIAEELGYQEMRLDTLPSMQAAVRLYRQLGFVEIDPYYESPIEGTHFLSLKLGQQK